MADMLTRHHLARELIQTCQALWHQFDMTFQEQLTDNRRADSLLTIGHQLHIASHHLHTQLLAIAHVIVETFLAMMSETIIIARNQHSGIQLLMQNLLHKLASRQRSQFLGKRQNHKIIDVHLADDIPFLLQRRQQLRMERSIEHLPRQTVESHDSRTKARHASLLSNHTNQMLMPLVNTIEHTERCHTFG